MMTYNTMNYYTKVIEMQWEVNTLSIYKSANTQKVTQIGEPYSIDVELVSCRE